MPKILVIDDDQELLGLLQDYLRDEGLACAGASGPEQGLREARSGTVDAVVLDVMLPGMNGFEVLRLLRAEEKTQDLPVLMLTARGEEIDRVVGLEMGADDYLGKPFSPRELVARLRALLRRSRRGAPQEREIRAVDDIVLQQNALCVTVGGRQQELSMPELRLLRLLLQRPGQVVGREFLYKEILGHPAYPTDRSLDMLVSRLRKKLGPRTDGRERIKAVRGEGYMYLTPGEPR